MNYLFLLLQQISWIDLIDILLVSILVYQFFVWLKETRAFHILKGLTPLLIIYLAAEFLNLTTIKWLVENLTIMIAMALIVVFQPELRKTFERIGSGKLLSTVGDGLPLLDIKCIQQIIKAVDQLAKNKTGALIVLERSIKLDEFTITGIPLFGYVTYELLTSVFHPETATHDGAVIIREGKISAVSCLLPLSKKILDSSFGTRHRAAIGLSEQTDAVIIVVSEETGTISLAEFGKLTRFLTRETLEEQLFSMFRTENEGKESDQSGNLWTDIKSSIFEQY